MYGLSIVNQRYIMSLSGQVLLCEVGPRDGFQFESKPIPTEKKLELIQALIDAGLKRIQVTSFVHPRRVPQMADAEALLAQLPWEKDVQLTGLVLNEKGVERAAKTKLKLVDISIATNETHSRDNANMTVSEGVARAEKMIMLAKEAGLETQLGLQTVFGYHTPGDTPLSFVVALAERFCDLGLESFSLADSTGMANPEMISERIKAVQAVAGDTPLVLHLHDTRGLGMANVVTALRCGIRRFDTSFGGLGGCPFIPGATGNIATEDTAYLMASLGFETGVNLTAVSRCAIELEAFLGKQLPGRIHGLVRNGATVTLPV